MDPGISTPDGAANPHRVSVLPRLRIVSASTLFKATTAIFVVFIGLFFVLTLAVVNTMKNVDQLHINTCRILGVNKWQLAIHIILPALLVILRMNFFGAWTAVLSVEVVGTNTGLGAIIITGRQMMNMKLMLLGMALIGLVAFLIDRLFLQVQSRILWWRSTARV
jgi:NitT/TauT family transport system permease protein